MYKWPCEKESDYVRICVQVKEYNRDQCHQIRLNTVTLAKNKVFGIFRWQNFEITFAIFVVGKNGLILEK